MSEELSPAQQSLKDANLECSDLCFKLGRTHWQLKKSLAEAEDLKIQIHNLEVDLEKATKKYQKAQEDAGREYQEKKLEEANAPKLEVVQ